MQDKFAEMAEQELQKVLAIMPSEPVNRSAIFTETARVLDYWSVFQLLLPGEKRLAVFDFDLIQWGWNLAAEHLFTPVEVQGGFPMFESNNESRLFAMRLLHQLGRSVLLYRASEMIRYGFLNVECNKEEITVRRAGNVAEQFLDNLEFHHLEEMRGILTANNTGFSRGWKLFTIDDYANMPSESGAFLGHAAEISTKQFEVENLDELMTPLVHPWDSGQGIMMGYGALPEVDNHFFAQAIKMAVRWREETGVHPDAYVGELSGSLLTQIIAYVTALHTKHIRFALLAMKNYPEISIPQSLTIWGPFEELVESIADYSKLDRGLVRRALDAITMRPEEVSHLHKFTTPLVPLLISLGNGLVLRPVSSLIRNPMVSAIRLQEWRNPAATLQLSAPREDWMRAEIYALFQGNRYKRVTRNIKIRDEKKIVTDIDGAVFDIITGDLALFQIKWQDYFTNDVRKLRSRAQNLAKELDEWAEKIESWIEKKGKDELIKALQLKLGKGVNLSSVYLFGISRTAARTRGFGFTTTNDNLVIANWPQFMRVRYELGPVVNIFQQLFDTLKHEMDDTITPRPVPVTIKVSETSILFEDIWNMFDDEDEET